MERILHPHGMAFERQQTSARRSCSICARRLENRAFYLTEDDAAPDPRQSWLLCAPCNVAVQSELERSTLRPALRTRVAVGLVASQRGPSNRAKWWQERYWDELDESGWNHVIIWSIVGIAFGHVLVFIILMMWPYLASL